MMKKNFPEKYTGTFTAMAETLDNIFNTGIPADKALEKMMRTFKGWENEKRKWVAETIYDIIRNRRLLDTIAQAYFKTENISYQHIIIAWSVFKGYALPQKDPFIGISANSIESIINRYASVRMIRESVPDWLDTLGEKELGKQWDIVLHSLNQKPSLYIRANILKTTKERLQEELGKENIQTRPLAWSPDALEVLSDTNIFRTTAFQGGLFEVQDASSQMVAPMLDVSPGMRVIDACAGTGGKTLHIASLMNNKGKIIALDNKEWRLEELKKRCRRAGVFIVEGRLISSSKIIKRLHNTADRLLLDVPCSGLGVLRRNPDTKWKLSLEQIDNLRQQQQEILSSYSSMLKAGGKMVYSTCSILQSEGEEQIRNFWGHNGENWTLAEEKRFSPEQYNSDGFYIATLKRLIK